MTASNPCNELAELAKRYWEFYCHEQPIMAILAGEFTRSDLLLRESLEDHRRRDDSHQRFLAGLQAIPFARLDAQDRITFRLLERELRLAIRTYEVRQHLQPTLYPFGPEVALTVWADATALASTDDAELYLARLKSIPAGLSGFLECFGEGLKQGHFHPKIVISRCVATLRAQLSRPLSSSSFMRPFLATPVKSERMLQLKASCESVLAREVLPAFTAYTDTIEQILGAVASDELSCSASPIAGDVYRLLIDLHTTEAWEPGKIHELGLSEVRRIDAEIREIAAAAGHPGDLKAFRAALLAAPGQILPDAEALKEKIEVLSKRIDARLPELFGHLPRMSYGVRSIPVEMSPHLPPAYAQPNPADGSTAGVHWVTSLPQRCPTYMHIPLALHEAWPGHLMHLALLQEMDLPDFRKHGGTRYTACLEGWALYCEWLGEELGFYDTPEKRFGRLEMEIWRACRLVVDTGIHEKGWTRDQAIAFMTEYMAQSQETIEAEVDRYIGLPAQALAYQIGNRKFRSIRAEAESTLGARFRARNFHDALMRAGAVTLPVLEEVMKSWMQEQLAAA